MKLLFLGTGGTGLLVTVKVQMHITRCGENYRKEEENEKKKETNISRKTL